MNAVTARGVVTLTMVLAAMTLGPGETEASEGAGGNGISASVVHVQVYRSRFDWSMPWRQQAVQGVLGSGFLIGDGRIVTNAHVVADARQILVRRPDQANPRIATVEAVAHDCDLAVLRVDDRGFADGLRPLALGELPRTGSQVLTYGFPLGGQDVSSTAGIVSRVEMRGYVHSGADAHLVVQTDAAINPGNSGGPVVQDGRVVGVAFQGFPGFDNMGFFIPIPVVRHFLEDLEDGTYDGFPDSGIETSPLLSPAYRRERGLPDGRSGVVVNRVVPGATAEGIVEPGDVLLEVDGHTIADDGTVAIGDARVTFATHFDDRQVGEQVRLKVWRDRRELELAATAVRIPRYDRLRNRYDVGPKYVVHAGLVFVPLDAEVLKMFGRNWAQTANRDLVWHQLFREAERPEEADREVIVLLRVLRHPVNSQMTFNGPVAVEAINGLPIRSLEDVVEAFNSGEGRFDEIAFEGDAGIEALDREKARAAHEEILQQYAITRDRKL
ncbi:MAG: trypsin-like peptidase domain-containing protein [Acidobacteria bacterium]|jgi:S1-C subfamily serine protease|nr:trypsin-like peptidase domain-containing protein [Acidobacteriota bacterium]